jgi:hypothetical protein
VGSDPSYVSSSPALHFSDYSFLVRNPVNRDDGQFLSQAMTSQPHYQNIIFKIGGKIGATLIVYIPPTAA